MPSMKQRSVTPSPASVVIRIGSMPTSFQNARLRRPLPPGRPRRRPRCRRRTVVGRLVVGVLEDGAPPSRPRRARSASTSGVSIMLVDRVDDVVPALGDRLDELVPQPRALASGERQRALVQQAERGGGVQDLGDDLQLAHVGDRAHHLDDLGELADRPGVEVLGGDLRHADDVVALRLLRRQLGDGQVGHQRPRRVVGEVVLGLGADERGELRPRSGRRRARRRRRGRPPTPRRPRAICGAHSVTRSPSVRESWIGDDVAGHGRRVSARLSGFSARPGATPS